MQAYVALLEEGTSCWRPISVEVVEQDRYRITSQEPDGENWEFKSGSIVRLVEKEFSDGNGLLAVSI